MIEHLPRDPRKRVEKLRDMPESQFRRRQSLARAFWFGVILFGMTVALLDQWSRGWDLRNPGPVDLGGMLTAGMAFVKLTVLEQRDTIRRLALPKVDVHASSVHESTPLTEVDS